MNIRNDSEKRRRFMSSVIASEIIRQAEATKKAKTSHLFSKEIFDKGFNWFNEGLTLEDALDELKNNTNFIKGYELAARQDKIRKTLEIQGALWFYNGKSLDDAIASDRDNEFFQKGYNDAKEGKKHR